MTYVLNKSLKMKKKDDSELYAPGTACTHRCGLGDCFGATCTKCSTTRKDSLICSQKQTLRALKNWHDWWSISSVFKIHWVWKNKNKITYLWTEAKECRSVVGYDANSLYLYCAGQEMPCGKEHYGEFQKPTVVKTLCDKFLNKEIFGLSRLT